MAGQVFQALVAGVKKWVTSIQTSAGAGDAGKIPALNSAGQLDITMFPSGLANTIIAPASEDLAAGDLVNLWDNAGTISLRKADASTASKRAHGMTLAAFLTGASATAYKDGAVTGLSGLTKGSEYYLSTTPGGLALVAAVAGYTTSGNIIQHIGVAESATKLQLAIDPDPAQIA